MAITNAPIMLVFGGSPANPAQATSFQFITAWGQTQPSADLYEAIYQAFFRNSQQSGRMGQYFNSQTLNGAVIPLLAQSATMNGTTTITGLTSTAGIVGGSAGVGWPVVGGNIAANSFVSTVNSATSVTLSTAATGSATNTIFFVPILAGSGGSATYPVIISANDICQNP